MSLKCNISQRLFVCLSHKLSYLKSFTDNNRFKLKCRCNIVKLILNKMKLNIPDIEDNYSKTIIRPILPFLKTTFDYP